MKISRMLAVAVAVSALAFSGTQAKGDATWTGKGDGASWLDMANWDADPTAAGTLTLATGSSTVNFDTTDTNVWAKPPTFVNVSGKHTLTLADGGKLKVGYYFRVQGGTGVKFKMTGGSLDAHITMDCGRSTAEFSGGVWTNSRGIRSAANIYVIGSAATLEPSGITLSATPAFHFKLDAGGISPINVGKGAVRSSQGSPKDTVVVTVTNIQYYLDNCVGEPVREWDLIKCRVSPALDNFPVGPVDGGLGVVTVKKDKTGLVLTIK